MATKCRNCPIRTLDIFHRMSEKDVAFMERFKMGEMSVEPGAPLISEGSNSPQLFTALSGMGLRYKLLEDGRRQVLSFVLPGDFIGMQAGILKEMDHSVEATTSMRLCVFDRTNVWSLFQSHPERAFDLTWLSANEERFLGEAITSVGQQSALERVAWALSRLFRRLKALNLGTGTSVPLPYRQQDLADALGLSLVHTNKTLAKLRTRQMANWSDGKLTVPDVDELEALAKIEPGDVKARPLL